MSGSLILLASMFLPAQDEQIFSGPQPGEKLTPFTITGATGDDAGKELNVVNQAGDKPLVIIFVHERTRPAFGLANAVMRLVSDRGREKIVGCLVYLSEDPTEASNWMNRIKNYFPGGITKGVYPGGNEGPGAYGLNRNVSVTILVGKARTTTANFALVQPSMEVDAPKIFKAIADVLGEKEVPKVAKYSGRMMSDNATNRPRSRNGAGKPQDPKLRPLLVPLIQKDASEEDVVAAARKIEEYAKANPASAVQIGDIARRIIAADKLSNYGTKKCQEYLTKWAAEFKSEAKAQRTETPNKEKPASDDSAKE